MSDIYSSVYVGALVGYISLINPSIRPIKIILSLVLLYQIPHEYLKMCEYKIY